MPTSGKAKSPDKVGVRPREAPRTVKERAVQARSGATPASATERMRVLRRSRATVIERMALALDYRQRGVSNRSRRLMRYSWLLARAARARPEHCEWLSLAAPLHDVGMIGIRESILRKPGPLDENEWTEIRTHPELGAVLIGENADPVLALARSISLSHHERWDGTGYPKQFKGDAIPWAGRLVAIVDAFEAMTVTQRHRPPITGIDAARRILAESGAQFDPALTDAFRKALPKFSTVLNALPDRLEGFHNLDFSHVDTAPQTRSGRRGAKA